MFLNKVLIYGNLTRDPELKSLPSGTAVTNFSVATNRKYKDKDGNMQEEVEFHNIVVFGRQAETVAQYLNKGSGILVEGRLKTRSWDADDGTKRYRTEIIADRTQFGPKKGAGDGGSQVSKRSDDNHEGNQAPTDDINPDDIPF